jgi:hypothetical protein
MPENSVAAKITLRKRARNRVLLLVILFEA